VAIDEREAVVVEQKDFPLTRVFDSFGCELLGFAFRFIARHSRHIAVVVDPRLIYRAHIECKPQYFISQAKVYHRRPFMLR